jgi:autotransporter adhesin
VAVGPDARATATNAVAIGRGAFANRARAVAIGQGSVANAIDTVSVGNNSLKRRIVNVAPGTQPNDAVNFAQLQAATAAVAPSGNAELSALRALVSRLEARIAQLERGALAAAPE